MKVTVTVVCSILILVALSSPVCSAKMVDLTTAGAQDILDGAIFQQINPTTAAGSGVFDSFLKIQKNGVEQGYNTTGKLEFDTKNGPTRALQLGAIPIVTIGGIDYREFCLDINQNGAITLSLDELKIYLAGSGNLTGYPNNFNSLIYNMDASADNWAKMNFSLNPGSGRGDIVVLIPSDLFGTNNNKYVYLYSKLGVNLPADDGFEEWGIGSGGAIIPEPATLALLGLGCLLFRSRK